MPRSSNPKPSANTWQEKKKDRCQQDQQDWRGQKGSTPAIEVNVTESDKANKKKNDDQNQNCLGGTACDLS